MSVLQMLCRVNAAILTAPMAAVAAASKGEQREQQKVMNKILL